MATRAREGLGRSVFGLGLFVMLAGLVWGFATDELGLEVGVAVVGLLLCVVGRGIASGTAR